jgi:hypothetical protein
MGERVSLMEFVKLLLHSDVERADFAADPDASLSRHGLADLSPADVHDAVLFVQDTLTVDWSQAYGAGSDAPHAAPVEVPMTSDSTDWWIQEEPEPAEHDVHPVHESAPDAVDDALYDAPDLHFGH